jgi:pimeloyl-ACP methyl ester carboxylesterase
VAARGVAWPDTPDAPDLLLRAFATLILDGYAAGTRLWQQTVAALRDGEFSSRDLGWLILGTELAVTRWDEDAWDELARRDLPTADGAIHPDVHRFSYDRMGATVTVVEGASHVVMLSRPAVVADVVREAVLSCAPGGLHS